MTLKIAKNPFNFYTKIDLPELMGLKAKNIEELLYYINKIPESSIYYHTHRFLKRHQYLSPEPPNDFAYWVSNILGEDALGEKLSSIDIVQFRSINTLRENIIAVIKSYLRKDNNVKLRFASPGEEFYFTKSISFILPITYTVNNLEKFIDVLGKISINSIYFHIFEARLRLNRESNDFSNWIENSLDNKRLADRISELDPYTYTLESLRKQVIEIISKDINKNND